MSESAAVEKSGILTSVAGSLGTSNLGSSSLGALKEGGEKEGGESDGDGAFGAAGAFGATAGGAEGVTAFFFSSLPLPLPPNSDDPSDGPVDEGGAEGALGAFFVAAL